LPDAAPMPHPDAGLTPAGCLVLVVGPSGVGKDTLLGFARTRLADRLDIVFPRRVITRPAEPTEDHEAVDDVSFAARDFALSWYAHGLNYGVPRTIETDLAVHRRVVVNVSRGVLDTARRLYPTRVIAITAPLPVLAARLARRGRESVDDVARRLARADAPVTADETIANDGSIEAGGQALLRLIIAP
jgi:ribose 1,5-bisphosphokinase